MEIQRCRYRQVDGCHYVLPVIYPSQLWRVALDFPNTSRGKLGCMIKRYRGITCYDKKVAHKWDQSREVDQITYAFLRKGTCGGLRGPNCLYAPMTIIVGAKFSWRWISGCGRGRQILQPHKIKPRRRKLVKIMSTGWKIVKMDQKSWKVLGCFDYAKVGSWSSDIKQRFWPSEIWRLSWLVCIKVDETIKDQNRQKEDSIGTKCVRSENEVNWSLGPIFVLSF